MVGAVALALAGCSSAGKDGGGESGDASGTMKMWTHNAGNEAELAVVKHIIDDWNESHDIKVQEEAFPQASYNDAIVAAASSGDLPCILGLAGRYLGLVGRLVVVAQQGKWRAAPPGKIVW